MKGYWKLLIKKKKEAEEKNEEIKKMENEIKKKDKKIKILRQQLTETKTANDDEKNYNKLFICYFLFQFLV
jgi:uncharacterized coiled-coil DUF342 family protein